MPNLTTVKQSQRPAIRKEHLTTEIAQTKQQDAISQARGSKFSGK